MKKEQHIQPNLKTLSKRHATKSEGVFYKEIIDLNNKNKVVDKVYVIRFRENNKDRLTTIGKEKSEGITMTYVKNKRVEIQNTIRLGEDPLSHQKKKNTIILNQLAKVYFDDKRCLICKKCKAFKKLSEQEQQQVRLNDKKLNCDTRAKKHLLNKYNKHLAPAFGKENLATLKKDSIQKFRQKLQGASKAHNTINGIIQLMSAIINYSIKDKELKIINPCVGIGKLATDNDRLRYLNADEVQQLLNKLKDERRALLFVKLALSTGGRLQTILNIKKIDLDLQRNSISLKDFKNDKTYTGFIDDELKATLKDLTRSLKPNNYIIGGQTTPLSANALSVTLRPILNELFNDGLETDDRKNRVVIHTLRHTFASHLAINGTPIFTIQKLMNHKDIKMTMRYAKLAPDSGMDMVKELYR